MQANNFTPRDRTRHEALHAATSLLLAVLGTMTARLAGAVEKTERPTYLIGYTEGRNDLPEGQFANWVTSRACLVRADGSGRRVLAEELVRKENSWTQFGGWSPDGKQAVILSLWESPENATWERANRTFRMTEGWLVDTCLLDLASGRITNLTAVDRVSIYNTGLFVLPDGSGYGFTPLINGISKPYLMDLDGRNKRDVSGKGDGFAYGYSASPDGKRITYHENYQIYVSNVDGSDKRRIDSGNPFNFVPQWSPDGEWLLFVSGEHYNCHPHVVKKDGTGLRTLADRGGYRGVVERLKHPDFHSESSDVPVWARDGQAVYYTAKVGESIELMRVTLGGNVTQLTNSKPGTRHYHPAVSPDGKWISFGSDRSGTMQLYVATTDGKDAWPITNVPAASCAMHGHWQPIGSQPCGLAHEPDQGLVANVVRPVHPILIRNPHGPLLRVIIEVPQGQTARLASLTFSLDGTNDLNAIDALQLFETGSQDAFSPATPIGEAVAPARSITLPVDRPLAEGRNAFWLSPSFVEPPQGNSLQQQRDSPLVIEVGE